jgi:hypothetical protein
MKRTNYFDQEELVLAGVFKDRWELSRKYFPYCLDVVKYNKNIYKKEHLLDVFYNIKFNANLYEEAINSSEEAINSNGNCFLPERDIFLPFVQKYNLTNIGEILANVMLSEEFGTDYYIDFIAWICRAWTIQAITGYKIFEIDWDKWYSNVVRLCGINN